MSRLTVKQAAQKVNVSPTLIYDLCAKRLLAHFRVPPPRGRILIDEADLDAFFATCRVKTEAPAATSPPVRMRFQHLR